MIRLALLLICVVLLSGCGGLAQPEIRASLNVVEAVNADSAAGFARVTAPRPFVFPRDHGPHPEYQTEWWYYTGNLTSAAGRHFGFQLTFFRRALSAQPAERESDWATRNIYMAHFAVSDVAGETFYAFERFSRDGGGLAGASGEPYRVFLEDWSVAGSGPEGMIMRLQAAEADLSLDLLLESTKPPVLQGDRGFSQKGSALGNASYYYSLTRMTASGTIGIAGESHAVQGLAWMDHEWGTNALEDSAIGWDWFSAQLDDGRELMCAQLRGPDGPIYILGLFVASDGMTRSLGPADVAIETLDTWRSPRSGAEYPARWRLTLPVEGLTLDIEPYLADQEVPVSVIYWEGAVRVTGEQGGEPVQGNGYVELTGYVVAGQGRN
ncbi:MAG: carotenoid 1,2-hydratase [Chloroflexales bacterium]|nr:carotenoid 1,2-hydratase [Chloroflexales bacterium]